MKRNPIFLIVLFRNNKILFFAFVLFVLAFIVVNIKRGMTVSPLFQYGMYSGPLYLNDSVFAYKFVANGKPIDLSKLSCVERDKLITPIDYYQNSAVRNQNIFETVFPILKNISSNKDLILKKFVPPLSENSFAEWYLENTEKIVGHKINSLLIYSQFYGYHKGVYTIGSEKKLLHYAQ